MTIKITLSSANMGDMTDERDFDFWARYVAENCAESCGLPDVEVDQLAFGESGVDQIEGATSEERDAIRTWLSVTGREAFCSGPWQAMAANG